MDKSPPQYNSLNSKNTVSLLENSKVGPVEIDLKYVKGDQCWLMMEVTFADPNNPNQNITEITWIKSGPLFDKKEKDKKEKKDKARKKSVRRQRNQQVCLTLRDNKQFKTMSNTPLLSPRIGKLNYDLMEVNHIDEEDSILITEQIDTKLFSNDVTELNYAKGNESSMMIK